MKIIFACVFACLGLLCTCNAADESPPLKIEGVKAAYALSDTIPVTLINLSQDTAEYGIGVLSMFKDGTWTEFITNIEDREIARKTFAVRKLAGNKTITFSWDPKKINKPYAIKPGKYRFYVAFKAGPDGYGEEVTHNIGSAVGKPTRHLIFSNAFELKP